MYMEPKVSVIIPVYNVEKYLDECLISVINQSYRNLEIIIVNDGSTDGSGKKCEGYKKIDSRISVFHKQNGGLSDARNYGLSRSHGEYVFFLDSDDFLDLVLIENLVKVALKTKSDIVVNDAIDYYDNDIIEESYKDCTWETFKSLEAVRRTLMTNGIRHMAWGKLFRSELWNNKKFTKGILYEDLDIIYYVMLDAEMISVLHPSMYYYRQRAGSIMSEKKVTEKNISLYYTAERVCKKIIYFYPQLSKEAKRMEIVNDMKLLQSILDYDPSLFIDIQDKIQMKVREYFKELFPMLAFKDKIKIISLSINKKLFHTIYNIRKNN